MLGRAEVKTLVKHGVIKLRLVDLVGSARHFIVRKVLYLNGVF